MTDERLPIVLFAAAILAAARVQRDTLFDPDACAEEALRLLDASQAALDHEDLKKARAR